MISVESTNKASYDSALTGKFNLMKLEKQLRLILKTMVASDLFSNNLFSQNEKIDSFETNVKDIKDRRLN